MIIRDKFTIPLPSNWSDKTVHSLVEESKKGAISISVDRVEEHIDLEMYSNNQIVTLASGLSNLKIKGRYSDKVGQYPASRLEYQWSAGEKSFEQISIFIHFETGGFLVVVASSEMGKLDQIRADFQTLLSSISSFA